MYKLRLSKFVSICAVYCIFITSCAKTGAEHNPTPPTVNTISVSGFSPAKALPNSIVVINGTNFNTSLTGNVVKFNGVTAQINSATATELVVTVPATATSGKIEVTRDNIKGTSTSDFTVTAATMTDFVSLGAIEIDQIAFDFSDQMFGENGHNIYKVSPNGLTLRIQMPSTQFRGIASDKAGNLYVAPPFGVYKILPDNTFTLLAGQVISKGGLSDGTGPEARFSGSAYGIAADAENNIYFGDVSAMRKITPAGATTTLAGNLKPENGYIDGKGADAKFGVMTRFTVDQTNGDIYVVDSDHYCIRKITKDGVVSTIIGSTIFGLTDGVGKDARIFGPQSLAADGKGNVFFSDADFSAPFYKIRMINRLGQVSTLITGTSATSIVNGPIGTATTSRPLGIAFDSSGNLYVVNSGVKKISKISFN